MTEDRAETTKARSGIDVPIQDYIGLSVEQREPVAIVTVPLSDAVKGHSPIHGGVLALLADVTCAIAIANDIDINAELPVSTNLNLTYYAQPKESPVRAEGQVVHRGSRIIGAECVIRDGAGRQLARAIGSYMLIPRSKDV